jgi:hypothetical protein
VADPTGAVRIGPPAHGENITAQVSALSAAGVRGVELVEPIDLDGEVDPAATVRDLTLLRELTGRAIRVRWTAGTVPPGGDWWRRYSHLQPPESVPANPPALARWRAHHFLGRCFYRHGPGFLQIRDRRDDQLCLYTVDQPEHLASIAALTGGASFPTEPAAVGELVAAGLVHRFGGQLWWAPYRLHRWPVPASRI